MAIYKISSKSIAKFVISRLHMILILTQQWLIERHTHSNWYDTREFNDLYHHTKLKRYQSVNVQAHANIFFFKIPLSLEYQLDKWEWRLSEKQVSIAHQITWNWLITFWDNWHSSFPFSHPCGFVSRSKHSDQYNNVEFRFIDHHHKFEWNQFINIRMYASIQTFVSNR